MSSKQRIQLHNPPDIAKQYRGFFVLKKRGAEVRMTKAVIQGGGFLLIFAANCEHDGKTERMA